MAEFEQWRSKNFQSCMMNNLIDISDTKSNGGKNRHSKIEA